MGELRKDRYYWMDLARIIACFAVVIIHCNGDTKYSAWVTYFCHGAVPIFVMISGTNFLKKDRKVSIRIMWKRYILPILCVFFVWSFLYALWNSYDSIGSLNFDFLKNVIINTINGHYHLWYIWMTVGLYCVTPFIKKVTDNSSQKELLYYLIIGFLYNILNFLIEFYPFDNFRSLSLDLRLTFVSGFLIYFVGGCFFFRLNPSRKIDLIMLIVAVLSLVFIALLVIFEIDYSINSYFLPSTIGLTFSIYWFMKNYSEKFSRRFYKPIVFVSKLTLPIYMMHIFGIIIAKRIFRIENCSIKMLFPVAFVAFLLCFAVSYILSLLPLTKKLFVGK